MENLKNAPSMLFSKKKIYKDLALRRKNFENKKARGFVMQTLCYC